MTGLPALRIKGSVQRRVVAAFTDRLVLKATAIFLAIVLWFVVNAKEPQIELVGVQFTPSLLDSSLVLREPLPQIQAIIAGAPKELIRLSSTPPVIHRQITANSPDTVVLDLRPEEIGFAVEVIVDERSVDVERLGDVLDRDRSKVALGEKVERGSQELVAGATLVAPWACGSSPAHSPATALLALDTSV